MGCTSAPKHLNCQARQRYQVGHDRRKDVASTTLQSIRFALLAKPCGLRWRLAISEGLVAALSFKVSPNRRSTPVACPFFPPVHRRQTMKLWCREDDPVVGSMRARLDAFYASTREYDAFNTISNQASCWVHVAEAIQARIDKSPPGHRCRVLEFGAGRSGFGRFLDGEGLRGRVQWEVQDVVGVNGDFLRSEADDVHIGDLKDVPGTFDIAFSTFVWEHVSNPAATLDTLLGMLPVGGALLLFSPRYDLPFYRPPALRHLSPAKQLIASLLLFGDRARVRAGGRPGFWVTPEPAVLHAKNWYRDADAVHLVSLLDLRRAIGKRGTVTLLCEGASLRTRLLQLRVAVVRNTPA